MANETVQNEEALEAKEGTEPAMDNTNTNEPQGVPDATEPQKPQGPVQLGLEQRVEILTSSISQRLVGVIQKMKDDKQKTFENGVNLGVTVGLDIEEAFDATMARPMPGEPVLIGLKDKGQYRLVQYEEREESVPATEDTEAYITKKGYFKSMETDQEWNPSDTFFWRPLTNSMKTYKDMVAIIQAKKCQCGQEGCECKEGECDCGCNPTPDNAKEE